MRLLLLFTLLAAMIGGCSNDNDVFVLEPNPQPAPTRPAVAADTIFFGGPILTIEPMQEVQALAVRGERIVAVGDRASVFAHQGPNTRMIDLTGQTLMPGLVEPHMHVNLTAQNSLQVDVGSEAPLKPKTETISELQAALANVPAGGWLQANNFDPSRSFPLFSTLTLQDLDNLSTTVPIFVLNASGHIAYVNSKAYELAGVTNSTPSPPGGTYVKDANGNLTGQINEPASYVAFLNQVPPVPEAETLKAFANTFKLISEAGVTTCGDMNTGLVYGVPQEINWFQQFSVDPAMPVRVRCYLASIEMAQQLPPIPPNTGNDVVRFIGIKYTLDGSTQGFTAALKEPYLNGANGPLLFSPNTKLFNDAKNYYDAGWQLSCHANGDATIEQALDAYNFVTNGIPAPERRLRLEHFTVNEESQVERAAAQGVTVSMLINHTYYWGQVLDLILGSDRAFRIDPAQSLKRLGVRFSGHSDHPISAISPLRYMQDFVTRVPQLTPPNILGPDQRITIEDALRANTIDAAYQLFLDDEIGSLEVGKFADLVVLDRNPRTADPSTIAAIKVKQTWLGGVQKL